MASPKFLIDDKLTFGANVEAFKKLIELSDADLAPVLVNELEAALTGGSLDRDAVLDRLYKAMKDIPS